MTAKLSFLVGETSARLRNNVMKTIKRDLMRSLTKNKESRRVKTARRVKTSRKMMTI